MLADLVLPAAMWGEKTGTFTNADRTVHLSDQAVSPPGEARADLDIFVDYATRMGFANRDGDPLISWTNAEEAFDAFALITVDRPADYSGMSHTRLREAGYLQWPCPSPTHEGTRRLYTDLQFPTWTTYTEDYGHDLNTGSPFDESEHRSLQAEGKAILRAAAYVPPAEASGADYPLRLATGRTVYHWHTRTKTGRAEELQSAAPDVWIELHAEDASALGIAEGDECVVKSPRGSVQGRARLGRPRKGQVFIPFHYGYWDDGASGPDGTPRAANELTITAWDPVSKQPLFKNAAVHVEKVST